MRHLILEGEPGGLPVTPGPAGPVGESLAEYVDHSLDHDDLSTTLPHPQAYREYCAARRKALAARNSGPAARARRLWTRWVRSAPVMNRKLPYQVLRWFLLSLAACCGGCLLGSEHLCHCLKTLCCCRAATARQGG